MPHLRWDREDVPRLLVAVQEDPEVIPDRDSLESQSQTETLPGSELDKDGELVPRLATSWRWLDELTLEVKLRRGVTFHNGEVFDAEIVRLN